MILCYLIKRGFNVFFSEIYHKYFTGICQSLNIYGRRRAVTLKALRQDIGDLSLNICPKSDG